VKKETFAIRGDYIELQQLLKAADVTYTGGDAKQLILDGGIEVNGERETRRSKKLRPGDVVVVEGELEIEIVER
jgi:ribosome-associated protein